MRNKERAKKLSKILEYERLNRGMTQQEFADFIGIPRNSVTTYINGQRLPRAKRLKKIAELFNIDITLFIEE
jgi:transcriptional regulator with XRE-family HTH domain